VDAPPRRSGERLEGRVSPGSWREFAQVADPRTDDGARKLVEHIYSLKRSFWVWLQKRVDRAEFLRLVMESDRSRRALFDILMGLYAGGKPVRGEKTPAHVFSVPVLLEWFPDGRFIHMVRDPRGVFSSQRKKRSTSERVTLLHRLCRRSAAVYDAYLWFHVSVHWNRVIQLHHQYLRRYPGRYVMVKFEDLITRPEETLRGLCAWLEIEFSPNMLDSKVVNSSFIKRGQPVRGFDVSAVERWREHLRPSTVRWFDLTCGRQLRELSYPDGRRRETPGAAGPAADAPRAADATRGAASARQGSGVPPGA
jgi:hypothetical protein